MPFSVFTPEAQILVSELMFLRVQLLRRGARSFQRSDHCYGDHQSPRIVCRCTIVMEYRRWSAGVRPWRQIPPCNADQSDCAKTTGEALHGHAFRWWKVFPVSNGNIITAIACSPFARFLPPSVAEKYNLDIPDYQGVDQIADVSGHGTEAMKQKVVGLAERQG